MQVKCVTSTVKLAPCLLDFIALDGMPLLGCWLLSGAHSSCEATSEGLGFIQEPVNVCFEIYPEGEELLFILIN